MASSATNDAILETIQLFEKYLQELYEQTSRLTDSPQRLCPATEEAISDVRTNLETLKRCLASMKADLVSTMSINERQIQDSQPKQILALRDDKIRLAEIVKEVHLVELAQLETIRVVELAQLERIRVAELEHLERIQPTKLTL